MKDWKKDWFAWWLLICVTVCLVIGCFIAKSQAADFWKVYKQTILPHEGGFTLDKSDPGNWTGGKVESGILMGTKYGIAANTYGNEFLKQGRKIEDLTMEDAGDMYKRDSWDTACLDKMHSQGIADELMDERVNMGPGGEKSLLTKQFKEIEWATKNPVPVSRNLNCDTVEFINEYTKDRVARVGFWNGIRMKRVGFYDALVKKKPQMRKYFLSWIDRTVE